MRVVSAGRNIKLFASEICAGKSCDVRGVGNDSCENDTLRNTSNTRRGRERIVLILKRVSVADTGELSE